LAEASLFAEVMRGGKEINPEGCTYETETGKAGLRKRNKKKQGGQKTRRSVWVVEGAVSERARPCPRRAQKAGRLSNDD
jgi:hypothetical protein